MLRDLANNPIMLSKEYAFFLVKSVDLIFSSLKKSDERFVLFIELLTNFKLLGL